VYTASAAHDLDLRPLEPDALADSLMKLLNDPELRDRMGRQAAEFAQNYGWEIIANRIVQLYEDVIITI